jgi:hypothetical protein
MFNCIAEDWSNMWNDDENICKHLIYTISNQKYEALRQGNTLNTYVRIASFIGDRWKL